MYYSSTELVCKLYGREKLSQYQWLVNHLDEYGVCTLETLGWQITLANKHYKKLPNGWVQVRKDGELILLQLVA